MTMYLRYKVKNVPEMAPVQDQVLRLDFVLVLELEQDSGVVPGPMKGLVVAVADFVVADFPCPGPVVEPLVLVFWAELDHGFGFRWPL